MFGGDVTEGAVDESIRHSISKMSHLHFTSNAHSTRRLMQLGEDPARIHTIGSTGIDAIKQMKLMDRETVGREVGMALGPRNMLVTFHPLTIEAGRSVDALDELFAALSTLDPEFRLFFTLSNADAEGRALNGRIEAFVASRPNTIAVASLGQLRYISLMNQVDVVVGNSSSGVLEAPSLTVPTVDIGDRQKGRERAQFGVQFRRRARRDRGRHFKSIGARPATHRQPLWRRRIQPALCGRDRSHPGFPATAQEGLLRYAAGEAAR